MNWFAIFDQQTDPQAIENKSLYPLIEYSFGNAGGTTVPNLRSSAFALRVPDKLEPIESKQFAFLSD